MRWKCKPSNRPIGRTVRISIHEDVSRDTYIRAYYYGIRAYYGKDTLLQAGLENEPPGVTKFGNLALKCSLDDLRDLIIRTVEPESWDCRNASAPKLDILFLTTRWLMRLSRGGRRPWARCWIMVRYSVGKWKAGAGLLAHVMAGRQPENRIKHWEN